LFLIETFFFGQDDLFKIIYTILEKENTNVLLNEPSIM
jgi:hypothetical protein